MAKLITPTALKQAVGSNAVVFVYADWCPACQTMKPVFEDVAAELKTGGQVGCGEADVSYVHFCKLDYVRHGEAVTAQKIGRGALGEGFHTLVREFPTVVFFRRGAEPTVYAEGNDAASLKAAILDFF